MIFVGVRTRIETGPIREKHSFTKHIPQSPIKTLFLTTVILYCITDNRIHKASPVNMIIKSRNIHTRAPSVTANFAAIHEPIMLPAASVIPGCLYLYDPIFRGDEGCGRESIWLQSLTVLLRHLLPAPPSNTSVVLFQAQLPTIKLLSPLTAMPTSLLV